MSAERFHAQVWSDSAHAPRTCVTGMEWKGNGRGMEKSIMSRHLRNARAVDNSRCVVAAALGELGVGA